MFNSLTSKQLFKLQKYIDNWDYYHYMPNRYSETKVLPAQIAEENDSLIFYALKGENYDKFSIHRLFCILSHEISHHFKEHKLCSYFSPTFLEVKDTAITNQGLKNEREADVYCAILHNSFYNQNDDLLWRLKFPLIMDEVLEATYKHFNINKYQISSHGNLHQRQTLILKSDVLLALLANYSLLLKSNINIGYLGQTHEEILMRKSFLTLRSKYNVWN